MAPWICTSPVEKSMNCRVTWLHKFFSSSILAQNFFCFHDFFCSFFLKHPPQYVQHVNYRLTELDNKTWYGWTATYGKTKLILNIKWSKHPSSMPVSETLTIPVCLLKLHILLMDWKVILGPTVCSIFNRRAFCSKRAWRVFFSHVLYSQTKELVYMLYLRVNDVKISNPLFLCFQNYVYLLIHCADSFVNYFDRETA